MRATHMDSRNLTSATKQNIWCEDLKLEGDFILWEDDEGMKNGGNR